MFIRNNKEFTFFRSYKIIIFNRFNEEARDSSDLIEYNNLILPCGPENLFNWAHPYYDYENAVHLAVKYNLTDWAFFTCASVTGICIVCKLRQLDIFLSCNLYLNNWYFYKIFMSIY